MYIQLADGVHMIRVIVAGSAEDHPRKMLEILTGNCAGPSPYMRPQPSHQLAALLTTLDSQTQNTKELLEPM